MQKLSDVDLLSLNDQDLVVVDLEVDLYSMEAKLSSGLCVYVSGHKDEVYSGRKFLFGGYVNNLMVAKGSPSEVGIDGGDYMNYCSQRKLPDVYIKLEQIAKNIINFSRGRVLFYELGVCEVKRNRIGDDLLKKYRGLMDKAILDTDDKFKSEVK